MKTPKSKESPEAKAAREAEEQRIAVMQARADAEETAAGRKLLSRRTRQVIRLFGARQALAGVGVGTQAATGGGAISLPGFTGGSASFPLGYGGDVGSVGFAGGNAGGRNLKSKF